MNQLFKLKKNNLTPLETVSFGLEKEIQVIIEENVEELFGLKLVKSEFSVGNYRLDSLCYDEETKSFVIIEYKKGSSYSVIDQGYSYLSTMLNNKSHFVLEFNENLDKTLKRNEVDWSQSRIILISPSFNSYQKTSVNFKDVPVELWEISKFSNDTISLNQISSTSKESIKSVGAEESTIIKSVSKEIEVFDENSHLNNVGEQVKNLYSELKDRLLGWEHMDFRYKKYHISILNKNKVKIYLILQKKQIKISFLRGTGLRANATTRKVFNTNDPNNPFHFKKNEYVYYLKNEKDLDYIVMLLKQKYDS